MWPIEDPDLFFAPTVYVTPGHFLSYCVCLLVVLTKIPKPSARAEIVAAPLPEASPRRSVARVFATPLAS